MRISDLSLFPLSELGFVKDQIIFIPVSEVASFEASTSFRRSAKTALPLLWQAIGTTVKEVRIAYFPTPTTLRLDFQGEKGFGRLTYENSIEGINVTYSQLDKFVDNLPTFYADVLTAAAPKKTISVSQFYGDRDVLEFDGTGAQPLSKIIMKIQSVFLGALEFKDTKDKLDSRSISFEDRILSARAGALIAHSTYTIPTPPAVGAAVTPVKTIQANLPAPNGSAEAELAKSVTVFTSGAYPSKPANKSLADSERITDTPVSKGPSRIEFVRMPSSKADLDFNRLFTQAQSIVDTNFLVTSFDNTNKLLAGAALYRMKDALDALSVDANDRDALAFVRQQTQILSGPAVSPLIMYRSTNETAAAPPAAAKRTQDFFYCNSTVDRFRQALKPHMTPASLVQFENDVAKTAVQSTSSFLKRPLPHDHAVLIGSVGEASFGSSAWMKNSDEVFGIHPAVLAGSTQAKILSLAAESMIISSVRASKRATTAIDYLPGLRRLQQYYQYQFDSTFDKMIAASAPDGSTGLIRDVSGFNSFGALYAYGYANMASHVDTTDYRLGLEQGQFEGGTADYDLLKSKMTLVDLGDLAESSSIDDILQAIERAAASIAKFVTGLQELVEQLKSTVSSLEKQLSSTLSDLGGAGRGVRTLAYAGTGFLVGGPIGAGVGALISLF